ncbi:retron Ec78 anti-phage system effector HNH endonuclease PtuB [Morganella morganii]|uniref:retron Ec78 anti-phage system effector HNH endonuclease PtuB n=1 Tax=Morganella morganii TaxID=582 RepID=UPI000E655299|nr:retron Ec78 anti-phage system effector HNH endonuclease PtuB [Morganella morganii]
MKGFRKASKKNNILSEYLQSNPNSKWKGDDGFYQLASKEQISSIYDSIHTDQGGICAYCEIMLKWPTADFTNDFRVEHFHPEDDWGDNGHNFSLDWNNLIGCCHGGSSKTSRSFGDEYTGKKFHSCDVLKGNKILDNVILNPLVDIPVDTSFFDFKEDGSIIVGKNCPENMKVKSQQSIDELNLDCLRLKKFRAAIIDKLRETIQVEINDIQNEEEINFKIIQLRDELLTPSIKPEFYSTINWYLVP